jgi:hypothetical protein
MFLKHQALACEKRSCVQVIYISLKKPHKKLWGWMVEKRTIALIIRGEVFPPNLRNTTCQMKMEGVCSVSLLPPSAEWYANEALGWPFSMHYQLLFVSHTFMRISLEGAEWYVFTLYPLNANRTKLLLYVFAFTAILWGVWVKFCYLKISNYLNLFLLSLINNHLMHVLSALIFEWIIN